MLDHLSNALVEQKKFVPIDQFEFPEADQFDLSRFHFVGVRTVVGSVVTAALYRADELELDGALAVHKGFFAFTNSMRRNAGRMSGAKLGSFGVLMHFFQDGCSLEVSKALLSHKEGSAWGNNYCVSWVLDGKERKAIRHRGLPVTVSPGYRWVTRILQEAAV